MPSPTITMPRTFILTTAFASGTTTACTIGRLAVVVDSTRVLWLRCTVPSEFINQAFDFREDDKLRLATASDHSDRRTS